MLHGVGVDVVDVARVERLLDGGGAFASRWFTAAESAECLAAESPATGFARLLAAKEAAWKSLRVAWDGSVPWASIEVTGSTVVLRGAVAAAAALAGVGAVCVSTSAVPGVATATALAHSA